MRKHATTLIAPLAALAIAGTVAGPAQATGAGYGGDHGGSERSWSIEIETNDEATAAFEQAGVDVDALAPATSSVQEDGATVVTFPIAEDDEADSSELGVNDVGQVTAVNVVLAEP